MGEEKQELQKQELPVSVRFTNAVLAEFAGSAGEINFGPYQRKLAQHLYIKIDTCLKEFDAKRSGDKAPIVWGNVNMQKLAMDAMHRIELGLDALVQNHIHPIPYWNGRIKKYDLDLRIGYEGKSFYRRAIAIDPPADVRYMLVYSTDKFTPFMKSSRNEIEGYELEVTNPFDRGDVIGGFGYIIYDDPRKNKLVMLGPKEFKKSKDASKGGNFWNDHPDNMKYKTIVHRTVEYIKPDPRKMTTAVASAEASSDDMAEQEIIENANTGEVIDIQTEETTPQLPNEEPIIMEMPQQQEPELVGAGAVTGGNGSSTAAERNPGF